MPLRFPRRFSYGDRIIDAFSFDTLPVDGELPPEPSSVRFRAIAEILLHSIQRCVAADRDLNDDQSQISPQVEPVLGNLAGSLPELLDFLSNKPLSVSEVSETASFGGDRNIQE